MLEQNIRFLDCYKSVDRFIRDAYGSSEGVSEYLRQMEQDQAAGSRLVVSWNTDRQTLYRVRKIRNLLSHEVGYDSDICNVSDYEWLIRFRDRLFSASDPLSVLNRIKENECERLLKNKRLRKTGQNQQSPEKAAPRQPQKRSFWQRVKDYFSCSEAE